ncbi:MAG: FeoB-associated Cys-rich membrane protein [Clostridiales Family XIII bacterium]|nr:FeoB-associated Cys-rich membrane protein [Clostridiales Family XIII bacterium]
MFDALRENAGTIVVGLILLGIVAAIIIKLARDKRKGKCVSCDCAGCSGAEGCKKWQVD